VYWQRRHVFRNGKLISLGSHGEELTSCSLGNADYDDPWVLAGKIETQGLLDFFGADYYESVVKGVSVHCVGLIALGFGLKVEDIVDLFGNVSNGAFIFDDVVYKVHHGVGFFNGLDDSTVKMVWKDGKVTGEILVGGSQIVGFDEDGENILRDVLCSTIPFT